MKYAFSLFILSFISVATLGQVDYNEKDLAPDKSSPFTAVKWKEEQPLVKLEGEWYHFIALDSLNSDEILDFCKIEHGDKWKKRFSEDLVEVLRDLNYHPKLEVNLSLGKNGETLKKVGVFSTQNRQKVRAFNSSEERRIAATKKISKQDALEDLEQLKNDIEENASYLGLVDFDFIGAVEAIKSNLEDSILLRDFGFRIQKLVGELGDRHASVREFGEDVGGFLPFAVAPLEHQVVALLPNKDKTGYEHYFEDFPFLKAIDGEEVPSFIRQVNWQDKHAPSQARFYAGVQELQNVGKQYYKLKGFVPDSISYTFTDGIEDTSLVLPLASRPQRWSDISDDYLQLVRSSLRNEEYDVLFEVIDQNIGYIRLPEMMAKDEHPQLFKLIDQKMDSLKDTEALIIDIRYNGGGTRDLLMHFAPYFLAQESDPWVANVARVRSGNQVIPDEESMRSRYLFSASSPSLSEEDRNEIVGFSKKFSSTWEYDESKYSEPFYMLLRPQSSQINYYYNKPVYILMNERSFSAASVFASALKGIPNVTLVGVTTDGSSGRSQYYYLPNSKIRVQLSSMISFQRNGKTLDTNGTDPDIFLERDLNQVLGIADTQLLSLLRIINL